MWLVTYSNRDGVARMVVKWCLLHIKAGLNCIKGVSNPSASPVGDVDSVVGDEDDVDDGANDKQQSTHVTMKPSGGAPVEPLPWAGGLRQEHVLSGRSFVRFGDMWSVDCRVLFSLPAPPPSFKRTTIK